MKAMILAAGLGKRMRPLTNDTPKPLLQVAGKSLIEYHLEKIQATGISEVMINTHWLGNQIKDAVGDGSRWQLNVQYSEEASLLDTAGGIIKILPWWTQDDPQESLLVINGDVFCQLDLTAWITGAPDLGNSYLAYISLADNPPQHPQGDFDFNPDTGDVAVPDISTSRDGFQRLTFAGISLYHPDFFGTPSERTSLCQHPAPSPLKPFLDRNILKKQVKGTRLNTPWHDIGTPQRLQALDQQLYRSE